MEIELLERLCREIDARGPSINIADKYYKGEQELSFLSPEAQKLLKGRMSQLGVNYVRLATDAVVERLTAVGFLRGGEPLAAVWGAWRASGMELGLRKALLESLAVGASYLSVWVDSAGHPVVNAESPRSTTVVKDPLTGEVTVAVKRWVGSDGVSHVVVFAADSVSLYNGPTVPTGGMVPNTGWKLMSTLNNPMGVTPVVDLTNSAGMFDDYGTPEAKDVWTLNDALNKLLMDAQVASEAAALPRRYASNIQIRRDAEGKVVPPFSEQPGQVWMAEGEVHFGQFPEASLASYRDHIETIVRQIAAVSGMPDHLVGLSGQDPNSGEQLRASETSLVSRAYAKQTMFGRSISRAAGLVEAIQTGGSVATDIEVVWKSPEARTKAQEADAAAKLVGAGLLPREWAWRPLGYSPEDIVSLRQAFLRQSLESVPLALEAGPDER